MDFTSIMEYVSLVFNFVRSVWIGLLVIDVKMDIICIRDNVC